MQVYSGKDTETLPVLQEHLRLAKHVAGTVGADTSAAPMPAPTTSSSR